MDRSGLKPRGFFGDSVHIQMDPNWPQFWQDLAHHPIFWTEKEGIGLRYIAECDVIHITRSFGVWTLHACLEFIVRSAEPFMSTNSYQNLGVW